MLLISVLLGLTFGLKVGGLASAQEPTPAAVATARFELRSDPPVALHHFLIDWASADAGQWPSFALRLAERQQWRSVLDADEQHAWAGAVEAYAATVGRNLLFDPGLLAVRDWAADVRTRNAIPAADRPLADAMDAVLPIYQRHWWPAHDASNRAWIRAVAPTLGQVEAEMIRRMEAAYGGRWPSVRIPVDVVVYANAVGAYSTGGRLTISSATPGNGMPHAIEMIFHEASHTEPMEQALRSVLGRAFQAAGRPEPERFWHDVIFFTSGEITRLVLARHGQPAYEHYGSLGVYRRGERWAVELPAFDKHWKPFLESGSSDASARRAALERLAREVPGGQ